MLSFLRKKMKVIFVVIAVVFVASMFYGISLSRSTSLPGAKNNGLAKVNGKEVDVFRYREMLSRLVRQFGDQLRPQDIPLLENMALGNTIDFSLILTEAEKRVRISGKEVDMAIDNIVQQQKLGSRRQLEEALKQSGIKMSSFKDMIKDEMLVQKMVWKIREEAKVSPDDLREIRASHILVSNEALANDLLAKIKKGQNFAVLAETYSLDPGSKVKGGDLGYFTTGSMVEPFEKAAFGLKVGDVSAVIKTPFGWHIIMVTDSRLRKFPGEQKDIEKAALADKQEKAFRQWFSNLRGQAKIEVTSHKLKGHELRMRGQLPEAVLEYKKALADNGMDAYLHIALAQVYTAMGNTDLAVAEYETAISVQSSDPQMYMVLAQAYEEMGKKALAVEQYKKASMVAANNIPLRENLLKIFQKLGAGKEVAEEKLEINRIQEKAKFEKSLGVGQP